MKPYRAIPIDGKDFVYGWYVKCRGEHYILPLHNSDDPESSFDERWIQEGADEDGWIEVIPETVGQFTGLKDRNGTEMYADDIVIIQREFGEYKEDLMFPTKCVAKLYGWHAEFEYGDNQAVDMALTYQNGREIIGNIHQSIELMKR